MCLHVPVRERRPDPASAGVLLGDSAPTESDPGHLSRALLAAVVRTSAGGADRWREASEHCEGLPPCPGGIREGGRVASQRSGSEGNSWRSRHVLIAERKFRTKPGPALDAGSPFAVPGGS